MSKRVFPLAKIGRVSYCCTSFYKIYQFDLVVVVVFCREHRQQSNFSDKIIGQRMLVYTIDWPRVHLRKREGMRELHI